VRFCHGSKEKKSCSKNSLLCLHDAVMCFNVECACSVCFQHSQVYRALALLYVAPSPFFFLFFSRGHL
jgi:hypothetical protein